MKSTAKNYVLDANAILDYFQDGPAAGTIDRVLRDAFRHDAVLMISVINLGEAFYSVWRVNGEQKAREAIDDVALLPIQVVAVDLAQTLKSADLKIRYKLPYADSFAASLAMQYNATLITSDRDFQKLGRQVAILWLSRP